MPLFRLGGDPDIGKGTNQRGGGSRGRWRLAFRQEGREALWEGVVFHCFPGPPDIMPEESEKKRRMEGEKGKEVGRDVDKAIKRCTLLRNTPQPRGYSNSKTGLYDGNSLQM